MSHFSHMSGFCTHEHTATTPEWTVHTSLKTTKIPAWIRWGSKTPAPSWGTLLNWWVLEEGRVSFSHFHLLMEHLFGTTLPLHIQAVLSALIGSKEEYMSWEENGGEKELEGRVWGQTLLKHTHMRYFRESSHNCTPVFTSISLYLATYSFQYFRKTKVNTQCFLDLRVHTPFL